MKRTKNEGRGLWYHDALSLMACKKSVQYMKEKGIFNNWLLPWGRLQEGKRYHESIPVDSPELMPLYGTLNMDIHSSARYHVAITSHIPNDDPRKYSFSTPKEIPRAYLRLVDAATGGAPSSTRIVQDCEKWIRSLRKIREAGGNLVRGFGRNGHRERSHGNKRGGYQAKKPHSPANWVHSDDAGVPEQKWRGSVDLVKGSKNRSATQTTIAIEKKQATQTPRPLYTQFRCSTKIQIVHSPLTVTTSVTLRMETTMIYWGRKKKIMRDLTRKL
jgi:hypothetical protein